MENVSQEGVIKDKDQHDTKHCEELKKKIEDLEKRNEEYLNGWKRAKADYINYKKEVEEDKREVVGFAFASVVMKFLPVYDNLETAFKHVPDELKNAEWTRGIENIRKQFESIFKELNIEKMKTIGEKFNPEFHDAAAEEQKEGVESGVVFEEVKAGYTMHGRTLVPARVKVGK